MSVMRRYATELTAENRIPRNCAGTSFLSRIKNKALNFMLRETIICTTDTQIVQFYVKNLCNIKKEARFISESVYLHPLPQSKVPNFPPAVLLKIAFLKRNARILDK